MVEMECVWLGNGQFDVVLYAPENVTFKTRKKKNQYREKIVYAKGTMTCRTCGNNPLRVNDALDMLLDAYEEETETKAENVWILSDAMMPYDVDVEVFKYMYESQFVTHAVVGEALIK